MPCSRSRTSTASSTTWRTWPLTTAAWTARSISVGTSSTSPRVPDSAWSSTRSTSGPTRRAPEAADPPRAASPLRSSRRPRLVPAVDAQYLPGDVAARVGHEVGHRVGDVLGPPVSLQGSDLLHAARAGLTRRDEAGGHGAAGRDAVDGHVEGAELRGE